ncbi:MAG: LytTR family DNA-binding domain-containing protein [Flavobacteriales bacterium]|nr:LytTR family DNA-binding domain-containing protein [Flavobacteriales bacterium]
MITAVIIDDEKNVREALYGIIKKYCQQIKVLGLANSADQGISLIQDTKPDLVFLDVQMPNKSGFDMLREMESIDFHVIFVTSFDKYALKAIKYSALDYLIKPVNIAELQMAVSKIEGKKENMSVLLENLNNPQNTKKIVIKHSKGIRYAYDREIIRCQSDGNYSKVYFTDGTNLFVSKTLKNFEELLPSEIFMRIHQSHIVNIEFVKAYNNGRIASLEMNNGDVVNVARTKKKEVVQRLSDN